MTILEELQDMLERGYTQEQVESLTGWKIDKCQWCGDAIINLEVSKNTTNYDERTELNNIKHAKSGVTPEVIKGIQAIKQWCAKIGSCLDCTFCNNDYDCMFTDKAPEEWDLNE